MTAVATLKSMGLRVSLNESGNLALAGLQTLSADERQAALLLAKKNKAAIMEELRGTSSATEQPTVAQLAHARSLLVDCTSIGGKLHVWHCTRCEAERSCMAWRHVPAVELRFQKSAAGKTFSAELAEQLLMEAVQ